MKRPNGYGTVTKLSGARRRPYAVRIPAHDSKGRVHQKYLSYHATSAEAWQALETYIQRRGVGAVPAPEDLSVTLQQVYDLWSARKFERAGKSVIATCKASWKRVSRLASMPIRNIGFDHWQSIIDDDERAGLSKSSIDKDAILINALSRFALERDWIMKDYAQFIKLPSLEAKHEKGAFTRIEVEKLSRMAADGVPGADAALVLCYTGFRINEFLSLTRFSYDEKEKTLTGGSKTAAGKNRVVPIHPHIQPYINRWLSEGGERLYSQSGKPITYRQYQHFFQVLMQALGKPQATPHWCRHTFASLLHAGGAAELDVKRLMGHSSKDVTEHYTHLTLDQLQKAVLCIA